MKVLRTRRWISAAHAGLGCWSIGAQRHRLWVCPTRSSPSQFSNRQNRSTSRCRGLASREVCSSARHTFHRSMHVALSRGLCARGRGLRCLCRLRRTPFVLEHAFILPGPGYRSAYRRQRGRARGSPVAQRGFCMQPCIECRCPGGDTKWCLSSIVGHPRSPRVLCYCAETTAEAPRRSPRCRPAVRQPPPRRRLVER